MTTSRVIRGTKAKLVLYGCILVTLLGVIVFYNNTVSQLDDVRKSNEICHKQEENLSTQLQVISDYKQRLEKSLKSEQAEHKQTRAKWENKLNEEKLKYEKTSNEAIHKFNALDQQHKLLQTEFDDYKEENSKNQEKLNNEINDLQAKLKELQQQLKTLEQARQSIKTQFLSVQMEKEKLEAQAKLGQNEKKENESKMLHLIKTNHELQRDLDSYKDKCPTYETIHAPQLNPGSASPQNKQSFNKQVEVSPSQYQIRDSGNRPGEHNAPEPSQEKNVADLPPSQEKQEKSFLVAPMSGDQNQASSKSTTKAGPKPSQASLNGARPLLIPTVTQETANKNIANDLPGDQPKKKLPEGVVKIPENEENVEANEISVNAINNRYRNKIDVGNKGKAEDVDKENGAHEEFDGPQVNRKFGAADYGLAFGENDPIRHAENVHFDKHHIDNLALQAPDRKIYDHDYKDQNDVQLEENGPEEDDDPEYADHLARLKDPAVRN